MNKLVAIAILVVGVILLFLAYDSYHSAASGVSRAVTGTSTDKTVWLLVGGLIASGAGLSGTLTGSKKTVTIYPCPKNVMKTKLLNSIILAALMSGIFVVGCNVQVRPPAAEVDVSAAPPPVQVDVETPAPGPDFVWIGGVWVWGPRVVGGFGREGIGIARHTSARFGCRIVMNIATAGMYLSGEDGDKNVLGERTPLYP